MRLQNARNRVKNNKIKVKVKSGQAGQSQTMKNLLYERSATMADDRPRIDYEKVRAGTVLEKFGGLNPIPQEELKSGRVGWLEQRLYQKTKFIKSWFVLRDSFLLCYESQESSPTECQFCIPLAESKVASSPKQGDNNEYCFMVLCGTYFNVMSTATEMEKEIWLKDLNYAKYFTHTELMNLAYFNINAMNAVDPSEQEGVKEAIQQSPYASFTQHDYIHETPLCGGMEGFLTTPGFSVGEGKDIRKSWKLMYFILRDSHLLCYDLVEHSELVTEPVGVLYLGGPITIISQHEESEDPDDPNNTALVKFYFTAMNTENENQTLPLCAMSEVERTRWINALNAGCKVTAPNILRAAVDREQIIALAGAAAPELDLLDCWLDPLCLQPYDDKQKPYYRHPDGRTLTRDLAPIGMKEKKFSKTGQPLDFFNRLLPSNATPMFANNPVEPIGVGVDGKHYALPSGRVFEVTDPHYDAEGQPLHPDTVKAADQILSSLKIACIIRSAIYSREKNRIFDPLGRPLKKTRAGKIITAEGQPLQDTSVVFDSLGTKIKFKPSEHAGAMKTLEIAYLTNDVVTVVLGKVGIVVGVTTLADIYIEVKKQLSKASIITFLVNNAPIPDSERKYRIASDYLPRIFVSCRNMHGKRLEVEGRPFVVDINHDDLDALLAKEAEDEFIKMVNSQKHKKSKSSPTPRSNRTPRVS